MKKLFRRIAALTGFVALLVVPAFAQTSTTGSIAGAVTDQTGAVVIGADVVIRNNGTLGESTVTTSDNGTFGVPSLATGVYTVTIRATGFKQIVVTDVKVDVAKASTVNVQLEIGAPTETVTIVG
ncbi:MAG TPA: carboxypeptidase-like regulatory domain-containing protein, partial [Pyrinomonadaceae bacterium]|nr:carboxypeptidase-like regulatory domain-containing protein [Pyrinomonadaceae bacterium]